MRHQGDHEDDNAQKAEDPNEGQESNHDLAPAVTADETAQAEEQRRREEEVRSRDHQPQPPQRVPEQVPACMSADERKRDECCRGREREGRRIVTRFPRRRTQAARFGRTEPTSTGSAVCHLRTRMSRPPDATQYRQLACDGREHAVGPLDTYSRASAAWRQDVASAFVFSASGTRPTGVPASSGGPGLRRPVPRSSRFRSAVLHGTR
jgi:hypothetical protein